MEKVKYYLYNASMLVIALSLSGCSDSEDIPGNPENQVSKGDAIVFATEEIHSRTAYGDATAEGYPLYWNENGDGITIYSDNAIVGTPGTTPTANPKGGLAEYTVYPAGDVNNHGKIVANVIDKSMLWGDAESDHLFYAVYPTERLDRIENGKITMQYHTNQVCKVVSNKNGQYKTEPDMLNAYMMAKNTVNPSDAKHVILHFYPIMTTLDITVNAGKFEVGTGIIQPVTVTGVSVIMPNYLKEGEFTYDMSGDGDTADPEYSKNWDLKVGTVVDGPESVFVNIQNGADASSAKNYVDLFDGESVNVMAFLPPMTIPYGSECYVKVHTTTGYDFIKKVTTQELAKRSRITIKLPDIYPDGDSYIGDKNLIAKKGNEWISRLDGSIPLKQLSIPGYTCTENTTASEIESMLNHGVRAFDLTQFRYTEDFVAKVHEEQLKPLSEFIASHPGEFLIVWIDENTEANYRWKVLPEGWTVMKRADITLAEARGKVLATERHLHSSPTGFTPAGSAMAGNHKIFGYTENLTAVDFSSSEWGCHYCVNSSDINKNLYNQIVSASDVKDNLIQDGKIGILMIPDANRSYDVDNQKFTYSDLLIQAVIDCNYKLQIHPKSSNQSE